MCRYVYGVCSCLYRCSCVYVFCVWCVFTGTCSCVCMCLYMGWYLYMCICVWCVCVCIGMYVLWVCVHVCVVHVCEHFPGLSHWVSFTLLAGWSPRQLRCCPAGSSARLTWVDVQPPPWACKSCCPLGRLSSTWRARSPLPSLCRLTPKVPPRLRPLSVPSVARCHGSFRDLAEVPAPRLAAAGLDAGTWDGGKRL